MYKLVTFDMYSATMDINGSGIPKVQKCLGKDRKFSEDFFKLWRSQQWNYLLLNNSMNSEYKTYDYITRTVLDYTAKKFSVELTESQKEELMKIWVSFDPWPEAKEVLLKVKEMGYKIGMLSNGDYKMLAPLADCCGVEFDYIFSADDAKTYKPSPEIYDVPLRKLGITKDEVLHVAGSIFDVMGTKAAGFKCAWSNRFNDYIIDSEYEPDYNMKDLRELIGILENAIN